MYRFSRFFEHEFYLFEEQNTRHEKYAKISKEKEFVNIRPDEAKFELESIFSFFSYIHNDINEISTKILVIP